MPRSFMIIVLTITALYGTLAAENWSKPYPLTVLPPESRSIIDLETGTRLLFLTSHPAQDINLYYHQRCWLSDSKAVLFYSNRPSGGLMACLENSGELVRLTGADGKALTGATASVHRNTVYAVCDNSVVEMELKIKVSKTTVAHGRIRVITRLAPTIHKEYTLNESCDGKHLAYGTMGFGERGGPALFIIDLDTGEQRRLVSLPPEHGPLYHVQWSRTNPHLLSLSSAMEPYKFRAGPRTASTGPTDYAARCQRLWVVDIRDGVVRNIYQAVENELVTHAVWWINDTILFTGSVQGAGQDDWSHIKVLDVLRGDTRIIGAGSWWPGGTPQEYSRRNWWHPSGSDNGDWVVADNWHGDIMLFEGRTSRQHPLTLNHRTYGGGDHPHPSFDRQGKQVIFTSHKLGSADVCVAAIPASLQELVNSNTDGLQDPIMHQKIVAQGQTLFSDNFTTLDQWHLEGYTSGVSLMHNGWLRLNCTGSQQGGIGVHAFIKKSFPDDICLAYDLLVEETSGLLITFLGMKGVHGEDAITGVPPRSGRFSEYTDSAAVVRSCHLSLSRYDDKGIHTGVSNWRRNPGLVLVGQGPDPCTETGKIYHVAIVKQGRRCQLQVDGKVVSGFNDQEAPTEAVPTDGKIGFRVIGSRAIVRIANLRVTALE